MNALVIARQAVRRYRLPPDLSMHKGLKGERHTRLPQVDLSIKHHRYPPQRTGSGHEPFVLDVRPPV